MKSFPLNKQNNKKLIVFFSGWGSDESVFKCLNPKDFDVIMFYDYRNFDIKLPDFSRYEKKYFIGWSFGVYVANLFFDKLRGFDKYVAVNGTLNPISDEYGIPAKIFKLTVDNFNDMSCKKFMSKISSNDIFKSYLPRTTEELKDELISVQNLTINKFLNFDKAFVSLNDKIIPSKNQLAFWQNNNTEIIKLDAPHYIFDLYENWDELL